MSRGRNVCSVDDRKVNKGGAKAVMAVAEIRAPIGKKFVRQKTTVRESKKLAHGEREGTDSGRKNFFFRHNTSFQDFFVEGVNTVQEKDDKSKMVSETVYEQWMDSVIENGVKNIRREYLELVRSYVPSGTQRAWESDKNYDKNRQKIDSFSLSSILVLQRASRVDFEKSPFQPHFRLVRHAFPLHCMLKFRYDDIRVLDETRVVLKHCGNIYL
ncbi:unnamed protein product [Gongylonema pulchrum]|uniref:Uncharacterized protein n=1 Tax=Gongylonema pulchrum TaxID=637853 RepID=A0A183D7B4_9BILA|nr:unnamed protein product [Gongylonema pulchrum]